MQIGSAAPLCRFQLNRCHQQVVTAALGGPAAQGAWRPFARTSFLGPEAANGKPVENAEILCGVGQRAGLRKHWDMAKQRAARCCWKQLERRCRRRAGLALRMRARGSGTEARGSAPAAAGWAGLGDHPLARAAGAAVQIEGVPAQHWLIRIQGMQLLPELRQWPLM